MYYNYDTPKGNITTFISYSDYNNSVSIYHKDGETMGTELKKDASGAEYFDYKGIKVPFNSFVKYSMKELKEHYENNDDVSDSELMIAIICDGMNNVRFEADMDVPDVSLPTMRFALCSGLKKKCTCKLVEDYLSMPHEEYKLKIVPADASEEVCSDRYYVNSFGGMLATNRMSILDSIDDGKSADEHIKEYFAKVNRKFSMD